MGVVKSQVSEQPFFLHGRVTVFTGQEKLAITRIKLTNGLETVVNYNHGVLALPIDFTD